MKKAAIISILLFILLVAANSFVLTAPFEKIESTKTGRAISDAMTLRAAIQLFEMDCQRIPTEKEGLEILAANPGIDGWNGPYLKKDYEKYNDPWGNKYVYRIREGEPFIFSSGPDGKEGTEDDVSENADLPGRRVPDINHAFAIGLLFILVVGILSILCRRNKSPD